MKTYTLYKKIYYAAAPVSGKESYKTLWYDDEYNEYVSWIVVEYENFVRSEWFNILSSDDCLGVYKGMKKRRNTDKGQRSLNADSHPVLVERKTEQQIKQEKLNYTKKLHGYPTTTPVATNNTFNKLFEME